MPTTSGNKTFDFVVRKTWSGSKMSNDGVIRYRILLVITYLYVKNSSPCAEKWLDRKVTTVAKTDAMTTQFEMSYRVAAVSIEKVITTLRNVMPTTPLPNVVIKVVTHTMMRTVVEVDGAIRIRRRDPSFTYPSFSGMIAVLF